jgi:hypothetical protein
MPHFNQYNVVPNTLVSSAHLRHSTPQTFSTINQHSTLMNSKAFGVGTIVKKNSRLDKQIFICHGTGKIAPLLLQGVFMWPKPLVSKFYLILAYKKTLRTKINQYFNAPAANSFFVASLPFIACLSRIGFADYGNKYAGNILLQDAFPAFVKPAPKISWETFNYLKYRNKLDLTQIDQIYYAPASAFLKLNPGWFSEQNCSYIGTFKSKRYQGAPKNISNWSYLPGRNLTNYLNSNGVKKRVQNPWNSIFNNYDDIPSKLDAIYFPDPNPPLKHSQEQEQRLKSDQKLHLSTINLVQPQIADNSCSRNSIDSNTHAPFLLPSINSSDIKNVKTQPKETTFLPQRAQESKGKAKFFTYFSKQCFDPRFCSGKSLNKSQNVRDLSKDLFKNKKKGFVGLNSTKITTRSNRLEKNIENSLRYLSRVDSFSYLFNRDFQAFKGQVPNLNKQRQVQYNIFNSLEIFGHGVKLTSQNDLTSNHFHSILFDKIPKESFMQQKQALRTDILNQTPPSWLEKLYKNQPNLPSRFIGEFLEGKQFQRQFFQQLEDHLVSKKKTGKILTLSYKEGNLGMLISLPGKDCFNLNGEPIQKIAPLLKRKVSGYLHPDSHREEVSFQKLLKPPLKRVLQFPPLLTEQKQGEQKRGLNYPSNSQMYSYPKHLKIDYGSKSSAYFDPIKVIQSNTASHKQNKKNTADINLKLKSNHFWGPSTSLTSERHFFLSSLKNKPLQTFFKPEAFLSCKTKPYGDCFPVLSSEVSRPRIKNPVKRIFVNFGRLLRQLIGKSQIPPSFEPKFTHHLSNVTKTLTFHFPTDCSYFYPRFCSPCFCASGPLRGKSEKLSTEPTTRKDHNNQLSNRITIQSINKLGESSTHKRPFKFKAAPVLYKTQWNYTQTNQLKPTSQKLRKVDNSRSPFVTELHEPMTLKSWGFLSQGGFIWIVFGLIKIFEHEYREAVLNYLKVVSPEDAAKIKSPGVDDNYRVIRNSKFRFNDIVGSEYILPKFAQVILYLVNARHSLSRIQLIKPTVQPFLLPLSSLSSLKGPLAQKREGQKLKIFTVNYHFDVEKMIPKGFLLVGPPGTGKTLLVKALAGEATVPVIIESGVMFQSDMEQHGGDKLKMLFKASKSLGPSLLFLDEIDKIGKKRNNMTSYTSSIESQAQMPIVLNFPYLQSPNLEISTHKVKSDSFRKRGIIYNPILNTLTQDPQVGIPLNQVNSSVANQAAQMTQLLTLIQNNQRSTNKQNTQDVMMLTQLLNQMDGLTPCENIIVIGATNRPAILDPALTRPGRFDKVIYLDLPAKRKRFELFKFYSKPGAVESINWDYFAKQTVGLSAAHISAAMNRSLLKAIYEKNFSNYWLLASKKIHSSVNLRGQSEPVLHEKIQNSPLFRKKKIAIHTFNSIEYGIEMVSKTNIQTHFNSTKTAEKVNKKLLGNFTRKTSNLTSYETLILNQSVFYYQFAKVLKDQKQLAVNFSSSLTFVKENQKYKIGAQPNKKHISNKIKRQQFYTVHQKSLRTFAYFHIADQNNHILNLAPQAILYDSTIKVRSDVKSTLPILRRYISRLIQNQTFGWHLLLNSTCLVNNAFFDQRNANYFSKIQASKDEFKQFNYKINWFNLNQKQRFEPKKRLYQFIEMKFSCLTIGFEPNFSLIYGNLCTGNSAFIPLAFAKAKGSNRAKGLTEKVNLGSSIEKSLLKWKHHTLSNQSSIFGDELFICRSAYYLSGKCLMLAALPKKIHEQPFSLWSFITLGDNQMRKTLGTELFLSNLSSKLLTKIEFEFYLLFIISGKVSETLMLLSNNSKNDSNIGVAELKTAGSVILAMITKYLLYSPKLLTSSQVNINLFQNKTQIPLVAESTLLRTIAHLGEIGNQSGTTLPGKGIQRYDLVTRIETPWWQFQSFSSICSINKRYGQWYRFYLSEPNQNPRNIEWVPPEKYYQNQMNNSLVNFEKLGSFKSKRNSGKLFELENIMIISFTTWSFLGWYDFQFLKTNNTFLIFELFNKFFEVLFDKWTTQFAQLENLNWNSSQLLQEDHITANLIFELFNKAFGLFENNRELLDNFVYLILCHETIRDFEIENYYSSHFLKPNSCVPPSKAPRRV